MILPLFYLSEDDIFYYILCKNATGNDTKYLPKLKNYLEALNIWNNKQLKDRYFEGLTINYLGMFYPDIGLAIVMRKSKMKLLYQVEIIDEQIAYFSLIVRLKKDLI